MILYEYRCTVCDHEFEEMTTYEERNEMDCPKCFNPAKKIMSQMKFKEFPIGIGKHISSKYKEITNFEQLKKHLRDTSTSTNIKWPEYFDGYSNPGMPTGWVEEVREEKKEKEEKLCQMKQERLNRMVSKAKEKGLTPKLMP